jgi:hypothetical protein
MNHRTGNFQSGSFCIDDGKKFAGITNNDRWNGWEVPWFPLSEIKAIQDWIEDGINKNDIVIKGDIASVFYHSLEERITCETMQHEGITHYFIDGWCWDKVITSENQQ